MTARPVAAGGVVGEELVLEALVVGEVQAVAVALRLIAGVAQPLRPEVERVG